MFKDSCCHGLERKDRVSEIWDDHLSGTAAATEMKLMTIYSCVLTFMYVVSCDSVCIFIVQSAHSKLHVVSKFIRSLSYSVACCAEITHCVADLKSSFRKALRLT